jgi:hypothetical protein
MHARHWCTHQRFALGIRSVHETAQCDHARGYYAHADALPALHVDQCWRRLDVVDANRHAQLLQHARVRGESVRSRSVSPPIARAQRRARRVMHKAVYLRNAHAHSMRDTHQRSQTHSLGRRVTQQRVKQIFFRARAQRDLRARRHARTSETSPCPIDHKATANLE